ncbi:MAG: hypothetical protein ACOYYS_23505 [Chloroflexota bacterium]
MNHLRGRIYTPVRRAGAEHYLLLTLLSFAASVIVTRLFLELTGYPQLGGGGLHIAHVLWGGVLLFVGALFPLIYANRWAYRASAILSGTGVGLFIDEVGKFITANNDYFFPAAAPIIYAFFLLTVLVYLRTRRRVPLDPRAELYAALEELEEVLDHDLDQSERDALEARLRAICKQEESLECSRLAIALLEFLNHEALVLVPERLTWAERLQATLRRLAEYPIKRRHFRLFLGLVFLGLGAVAFARLAILLSTFFTAATFFDTLAVMASSGLVTSSGGVYWFLGRILLEGIVGVMLIVGSLLLSLGKERLSLNLAYFGLLLSLAVVNLLVFYYDQFSTILLAIFQYGALLAQSFYRRKFQVL